MRVRTNRNGFALIELVLLLVIIGLLVGTGYYVWHSKQAVDKVIQTSQLTTTAETAPKASDTKPCALGDKSGTPYQAPDGSYGICLPDGWVLHRYKQMSGLFAFGTDGLQYRAGTKAKVIVDTDGKDGTAVGMFINGADGGPNEPESSYTKQQSFKTQAQVPVDVYFYEETTDPDGLGGLPKGGQTYYYRIHDGDRVASVEYGLGPNDVAQHELVKAMVRSVVFFN